nr:probable mediator of RNA polymerase II transcription subunit 26B [Ipomoea batatas]
MADCETLDQWRDYFRSANSDIFFIIEHAIIVAAADFPNEFQLRKGGIAEMLFTCKLARCLACNKDEVVLPFGDGGNAPGKRVGCNGELEVDGSKESKTKSGGDDHVEEMNLNQVSNCSYGDAEALTDEIEEESQTVEEVLRIKKILDNYEEESDYILFDSLRRLQLMSLSVENLQATGIGKSVKALRNHGSKQIRPLVQTLLGEWMLMANEWFSATNAISSTESTPDSGKSSIVEVEEEEEEGLPSPPMDEGVFFTTAATTGMELSHFFDGMDDDGNPHTSGEFKKNRENGRKPSVENQSIPVRKDQLSERANPSSRDPKNKPPKKDEAVMKKQTTVDKPNKPSASDSGPRRPAKPALDHKASSYEMKSQQRSDGTTLPKRSVGSPQNKLRCSDEDSVRKLEATKRRLQERYQEVEKAKKQRTIQVMELHDIPKQGLGNKNTHAKPGNHNKLRANGRR